jgi:hypothetical protein
VDGRKFLRGKRSKCYDRNRSNTCILYITFFHLPLYTPFHDNRTFVPAEAHHENHQDFTGSFAGFFLATVLPAGFGVGVGGFGFGGCDRFIGVTFAEAGFVFGRIGVVVFASFGAAGLVPSVDLGGCFLEAAAVEAVCRSGEGETFFVLEGGSFKEGALDTKFF